MLGPAAGALELLDGAESIGDGLVAFPAAPRVIGTRATELAFKGRARFPGHFGMLDLTIGRPALQHLDHGLELTIEGNPPRWRLVLATVDLVRGEDGSDLFAPHLTGQA